MPLVSTIQLCTAPCLLVSAIGLLQLSMTNRYTHLTNRIRTVKSLHEKRTLFRRIRMIKYPILLALFTVLMLVVLMLVLFEQLLSRRESDVAVVVLFSGALLSLVCSLTLFFLDMKHSLHLIHLMVKTAGEESKEGVSAV